MEDIWHRVFRSQREQRIFDAISRTVTDLGYDVIQVLVRGGMTEVVISGLDNQPVNINDCEKVTKCIKVILEVTGLLPLEDTLQVGSPGVERSLTRERDLHFYIKRKVSVSATRPILGSKRKCCGILEAVQGSGASLEITVQGVGSDTITVNGSDIDSISLQLDDSEILGTKPKHRPQNSL